LCKFHNRFIAPCAVSAEAGRLGSQAATIVVANSSVFVTGRLMNRDWTNSLPNHTPRGLCRRARSECPLGAVVTWRTRTRSRFPLAF